LGRFGLLISKVKSLPLNTQYKAGAANLAMPIFADATCPSNCSIASFWYAVMNGFTSTSISGVIGK
jgi:hypothetical protein